MLQGISTRAVSIAAIVVLAVIVLSSSFFVVPPSEMAAVRWLGGTVTTKQPPGML
jgi:regulator of protease activity HflC (stomatin/prohibitin superfamily)